MAFTNVCKRSHLDEGEWANFHVNGEEIILVWPEGGYPHAYQGMCPHENVPLANGIFNGCTLVCTAHGWVFDGHCGKGLSPPGWELEEFPLRIADDWIQVDLELVIEHD